MDNSNTNSFSDLSSPHRGTGGLPFGGQGAGAVSEKLLHFIWQFGYFNRNGLVTTAGFTLQIIAPGQLNTNQGPDFMNARIKIGDTLFAGSVELHIKTSDWEKHGHSTDANYSNVILHVVFEHDKETEPAVPVLALGPIIPKVLLEKYEQLMNAGTFIPCAAHIAEVKPIIWLSWKERLLAERLTRKAEAVFSYLKENNGHWEESFWWLLARNFGMKVNAEAFEQVAQSVPTRLLAKHKNSIHQLEALLLGQAGLLQENIKDDYALLLKREYHFLKSKYGLQPIAGPVHFLRMRPQNFPTVRLAQLAKLVHTATHLFSKVTDAADVETVKKWLDVTANDYWHYRYRFDEPSDYQPKRLGADMTGNIIINTIVPVLFAYGIHRNDETFKSKALRWLEQIKGEANSILAGFKSLSIHSPTAYDSQALIELKNEYCNHRRCLVCSVGNALLKKSV